jgi:signal recognition particle GTPase
MTAEQSLQIFEILNTHFNNADDAKKVVRAIENVVENKVESQTQNFEKIVHKDVDNLRTEMYKVFLSKEDKVDLIDRVNKAKLETIIWIVGVGVLQFLLTKFVH